MLSFADLEEWLLRRDLKMKGQKIPAAIQADTRKVKGCRKSKGSWNLACERA